MKNLIVLSYLVYIPVMVFLTCYVARNLFRNSLVFLQDIFNGRNEIAIATNRLFKTGFYLLNIGYGLYFLEISRRLYNQQDVIEVLSLKVGGFSIYLGIMLFLNIFLFFRGKKIAGRKRTESQFLVQKPVVQA